MKNQLFQVWYLFLLIIASLLVISIMPDVSILNYTIKKPDFFSPFVGERPPLTNTDTIQKPADSAIQVHPRQKTSIEEFGKKNLSYFFDALRNSKKNPVRIAFFGDSFIEGDILCGPFRDTLQYLFGGSGVGYMPITSEVTKFRTTILHDFSGWKVFSIVGNRHESIPLGLPGFCFVPEMNNEVSYGAIKQSFSTAKLFYEALLPTNINYTINSTELHETELPSNDSVSEFVFPQKKIKQLKISLQSNNQLRLYGATLEDSTGITVDNFSMRSNPGMGLLLIDQSSIRQFNMLRHYKLVILQYGLNALSEKDSTGYTWYLYKMISVVQRLKENLPDCGFLLLSVGDRCTNQNGKIATMPDVKVMRDIQRQIAKRSGIAFWDMFEGMGGENSIKKFTESQPPMAAKDYTHLTFKGGKKIAIKLVNALIDERKSYEKRN